MGLLWRIDDERREPLSPEYIVGRAEENDLCLYPRFVSVRHALLRWTDCGWELRDLGSTNGTYLDGVRLSGIVQLRKGARISFGDVSETWVLMEDSPPVPVAIALEGGARCRLESGSIVIPADPDAVATIYALEGEWFLETCDSRRPLAPGETFSVAEGTWKFHCPQGAAATVACVERPFRLEESTLLLSVSSDEERVSASLQLEKRFKDLGLRASFYLLLVLARQRLDDRALPVVQRGWVDVPDLLQMIPEYANDTHLNVDIFRIRRLLADVGMQDAACIVQRRRGQLRLGTDRVSVHREVDAAGRAALAL
jgi:FHA domain